MGFLNSLFGSGDSERTAPPAGRPDEPSWAGRPVIEAFLADGKAYQEVVGESHYQDNLWEIVGGRTKEKVDQQVQAVLFAEAGNPHDEDAISVWVSGKKVGHLPREDASRFRPGLLRLEAEHDAPIAVAGHIVGGGRGEYANILGIWLHYDPDAFGLGTIAAIAKLRALLTVETDPFERHYIWSELEEALYKSREKLPGGLDEFDAACEQHHLEMHAIRPTLVERLGNVPYIDTYRQSAISKAKQKDFESALMWATRGLEVYADNAEDAGFVRDLEERASKYRSKVASSVRLGSPPGD